MQDVEGFLFGGPQTRVFKAGAQGHRSAGMEQQKADNHHSERKSVISPFPVAEEHKPWPNTYDLYECFFLSF